MHTIKSPHIASSFRHSIAWKLTHFASRNLLIAQAMVALIGTIILMVGCLLGYLIEDSWGRSHMIPFFLGTIMYLLAVAISPRQPQKRSNSSYQRKKIRFTSLALVGLFVVSIAGGIHLSQPETSNQSVISNSGELFHKASQRNPAVSMPIGLRLRMKSKRALNWLFSPIKRKFKEKDPALFGKIVLLVLTLGAVTGLILLFGALSCELICADMLIGYVLFFGGSLLATLAGGRLFIEIFRTKKNYWTGAIALFTALVALGILLTMAIVNALTTVVLPIILVVAVVTALLSWFGAKTGEIG